MRMTARSLLEQTYVAYACGDIARVTAAMTDDVVYAQYVDREVAPFGGVSIGKGVIVRRFEMIMSLFDMEAYRLAQLSVDGDVARARVDYHFRHKRTGEAIEGRLRHEIWLRDGLIARYHEFLDRPRVEAFMRLVALDAPGPAPD